MLLSNRVGLNVENICFFFKLNKSDLIGGMNVFNNFGYFIYELFVTFSFQSMRTLVSELANAVWHLLFIKLFQLYSVFQEFVNFIAYCSKKNNKTIIGLFSIINLYLLFKHKKQLQRRQHYCTTIHTNLCICIKVDVHTKQTIN